MSCAVVCLHSNITKLGGEFSDLDVSSFIIFERRQTSVNSQLKISRWMKSITGKVKNMLTVPLKEINSLAGNSGNKITGLADDDEDMLETHQFVLEILPLSTAATSMSKLLPARSADVVSS